MTLIQAALNGDRVHAAAPRTPSSIAADAVRVVAQGARLLHVHCFDDHGAPSLAAADCDRVMTLLRRAVPHVPVSLTTTAAIEPDPARRLHLVQSWKNPPDYITLNQSEAGIGALGTWFLAEGGGLEACVASEADAYILAASVLRERYARVILEVGAADVETALTDAADLEAALALEGISLPQYHHGRDLVGWAVLERALRRGHNLRCGFEDISVLPDGRAASGNEEILRVAAALDARALA